MGGERLQMGSWDPQDTPWSRTPRAAPGPDASVTTSVRLLWHLLFGKTCRGVGARRSAPQRPGEHAGPVLPTSPILCKPQIPAGGRTTRAGSCHQSRQLPPIPELPLAWCCLLPIISGGLGGWRGAAGSSAAPKLGSPTFGFVLIFQSSILQLKSLRFIKYFSTSLNILHSIP